MSIIEKLRKMFEGFANHQAAAETVRGVLEKYLSNERPFAASIEKKSLGPGPDLFHQSLQKTAQLSEMHVSDKQTFHSKNEVCWESEVSSPLQVSTSH